MQPREKSGHQGLGNPYDWQHLYFTDNIAILNNIIICWSENGNDDIQQNECDYKNESHMQYPKYIILYFEIHDIKHQFESCVYCLPVGRVNCQYIKDGRESKEKENKHKWKTHEFTQHVLNSEYIDIYFWYKLKEEQYAPYTREYDRERCHVHV